MSEPQSNKSELWTRGFLGLQVAQFMGAFNDNIVKIVLMLFIVAGSGNIWAGALGPGGQSYVSLIMTIPYLILLDFAGRCADRFSKRRIVFWVKLSEIPISILIGIGLVTGNLWLTLSAYTLLMMESAFFNPSKYGMIREVISTRELSRGNGLMNMTTNIAIIFGTAVGGWLLEWHSWAVSVVIVLVATVGLFGVFVIPPLKAIKPTTKLTPWPAYSSIRTLLRMRVAHPVASHHQTSPEHTNHPMLLVTFLWAWFWFSALMITLIVPEYKGILNISDASSGFMMAFLGISIGVSCAIAGYISGGRVRMSLIPFGAIGLSLFLFLLAVLTPSQSHTAATVQGALSSEYWLVVLFLCLAGLSAGFYIVPLQALIQQAAPHGMRAQYVASANFLSYLLMTISAGIFLVARSQGFSISWIYGLCAFSAGVTLIPLIIFRKSLVVAEHCGITQTEVGHAGLISSDE